MTFDRRLGFAATYAVEKSVQQGYRWRNPVWRRDDGAFAEW